MPEKPESINGRFDLDEETIELAVQIAVARMEAERQFREFVSDPIKAKSLAEYVRMQARIYRRKMQEAEKPAGANSENCPC
ncbi:MAG: hypothetical protein HRF49_05600 [bacterium]